MARRRALVKKALEEVAKLWKNEAGGVIVEDGPLLKSVLKTLESCMSGGRVLPAKSNRTLSRESTFNFAKGGSDPVVPTLQRAGSSFGMSKLAVDDEDAEDSARTPLSWMKVVSAFEQPRLTFDVDKKHFVQHPTPPSAFPSVTEKSRSFRDRYQQIYHRLLRNPAFQEPSVKKTTPALVRQGSTVTTQQFYRITSITNLLGRGGTSHLLLGMLAISPTGMLTIHDPSGSITIDLGNATALQGKDSAYFVPGMIVLVDGLYEESWVGAGSTGLGNTGGVGGMIGGRFMAFGIGGPPVEKRNLSLGIDLAGGDVGGGLGWTDFLGQGSEKAVGDRMRRLEARLLDSGAESRDSDRRRKAIILGEVDLCDSATLPALRKVLQTYVIDDTEPPMAWILTGNFTSKSALAGTGIGSIEYKALFDALAAVLSEFPTLLRSSLWTFIPGDRDPWSSAFTAGSSTVIPRDGVPDLFTSRVKRAFASAKSEAPASTEKSLEGDAIWTSNPARISMFGPIHEMVVFRDDISGRLRRSALQVGAALDDQHDSPMQNATGNEAQDSGDAEMSGALPDSAEAQPEAIATETLTTVEQDFTISQARKLVLSLLPQSHLSPFPTMSRPTHWSYQSSLSLYPLPHTLVLVDAETDPFAVTFEGCHVLNPGKIVGQGTRRKKAVWAEYDLWSKRATIREEWT
ncbi:hypothetical protein AMS68_005304 [Peltaster fructicola]|uniref:DNA polymerase epsilon subunit B n=1 Tax=Peltaster fructicola TaxID=286661 RepID=A0A6H0XYD3_9PEZI|nr:hypothetical protein AMS68_005304 [Peltaster fructicola]